MIFSSSIFIFWFLPLVIFIYYGLIRNRNYRNIFLLIASLFFYAWGEPKFVIVMIISILINYIFGVLVDKFKNHNAKVKLILLSTLVFNLGIMFVFKYLNFMIESINQLGVNLPQTNIILPIGISFFTFQAISYVIDVYRGHGRVQKNPLNVGLYIAFFPQLIAGPIVRYETIAEQISNRKESFDLFSQGTTRFIIGLSKKVLLANTLAILADTAFSLPTQELAVSFAWLGAIAYTFQIYFDFSGYSDMAIGMGKMFGFYFDENFDYPYISQSVSEFWRRWHISLGTWFRDYVYFPLGGSKVDSKGRLVMNLFVVWVLTGVWHGANWTFIAWGMFYFVLLTLEKLTNFTKYVPKKIKVILNIYTLLAIIIGWVIFRSNSLKEAIQYLSIMMGIGENAIFDSLTILYMKENLWFLVAGVIFSMPTYKYIVNKLQSKTMLRVISEILYVVILVGAFIICLTYIIKGTYNPFIYFNF